MRGTELYCFYFFHLLTTTLACRMHCPQPPLHDRWELAVPRSEQWPSLQPSAGLPTLGNLSRLAAVGERLRRGCPLRRVALGCNPL